VEISFKFCLSNNPTSFSIVKWPNTYRGIRVARSFELCQILFEPEFCIFLYTIDFDNASGPRLVVGDPTADVH
jgi:hypothetical protein